MPTEAENCQHSNQACVELIRESRVMTLATSVAGQAWAAPVYYLFDTGIFYFFSSPDARHITEGGQGLAGAAIFMDASDATQLRGLQMSGQIDACRPGKKSAGVAWAYCRRFKITWDAGDVLGFFASRYRARLYRFSPARLLYMDNRLGMGTRTEIRL